MLLILLGSLLIGSPPDSTPIPVEIRAPENPENAVKAHMAGVVEVTVTIAADGTIASAAAVERPNPLLGKASLEAAREWRFGTTSEIPVRNAVLRFEFEVRDESPAERRCFVGPSRVTVVPPATVRVQGLYLPSFPARDPMLIIRPPPWRSM